MLVNIHYFTLCTAEREGFEPSIRATEKQSLVIYDIFKNQETLLYHPNVPPESATVQPKGNCFFSNLGSLGGAFTNFNSPKTTSETYGINASFWASENASTSKGPALEQ